MGGSGWREHALFVIVSMRPGREIAVPTASARAAQQTARYLLEHYSHIRPTWQVNPDAPFGPWWCSAAAGRWQASTCSTSRRTRSC